MGASAQRVSSVGTTSTPCKRWRVVVLACLQIAMLLAILFTWAVIPLSHTRLQLVARKQGSHVHGLHPTGFTTPGCEAAERPAVVLLMIVQPLGSGEHPAWEKLVALQGVFKHSCAKWVWMTDADAYVMNLGRSIVDLAQQPSAQANTKKHCGKKADVIAAGACLTDINTGSVIWRNNKWTRQFVSDAWHCKWTARPLRWWDQAAVLHMYKKKNNKEHVCIVWQRAMNAFANSTGCHDGGGSFQEGDLMVHFPGGMKHLISNMSSPWLQAVPLVPSKPENTFARAPLFVITQYKPAAVTREGRHVHVSMQNKVYPKESNMSQEMDLYIQPQMSGFLNWGWPVAPAPQEIKDKFQHLMSEAIEQSSVQT